MAMKNVVQMVLQNPPTRQATNNLKRPVKHDFWFLFILLVGFMYICKQVDFKQEISGKW